MSTGRQRFSIIPAAAVTDRRLEPRDLQVLCLLGRHTNDNGWCCRSQVKMAREIGCGRATVQRALSRLVDTGYVEHRAKQRESGADAAADYRVVIDPRGDTNSDETSSSEFSTGGAHTWAGVPIDGQGCPPKSGHGVPTHERAPMLTTLSKRSERERAREDEEFERARRAWPSGFADSRDDALAAWSALSPDQRNLAAAEIDRFTNTTKSIGRKMICGFAAYLRERRWEVLPPRPAPVRQAAAPTSGPSPKTRPTSFQLANKHLYPELFGESATSGSDEAAA